MAIMARLTSVPEAVADNMATDAAEQAAKSKGAKKIKPAKVPTGHVEKDVSGHVEKDVSEKRKMAEDIEFSDPLMATDFVPGRSSTKTVCPRCQQKVNTVTKSKSGLFTYLLVGGLVLLGCGLGCCLLPLSIKCCKDVHHKCPVCNKFLGKYAKLRL